MTTQKEKSNSNNHLSMDKYDFRKPSSDTHKEKWLQKYASRILTVWAQWQTPLGVACTYTDKIKKDLARFYDDPLKMMFIEASY